MHPKESRPSGRSRSAGFAARGVWPLVTAAEMQALDRRTIQDRGVPGEILMESAGRALVAPACRLRASAARPDRPIRALCGAGNNGGDGFVAVRHLLLEGIEAEAVLVGDPARLPADAAANWRRLADVPGARRVVSPEDAAFDWAALLDGTSVALDALFGTGLARPIGGGFARVIRTVNEARRFGLRVVAVDLPSGVAADTGQILGAAVEADETVTISLPKPGLALEPGRRLAGGIVVARVGIEDPEPGRRDAIELWNAWGVADRFPARPRDGHKGRFGHVLVAAGSAGKWGAAALATRAALRAGAGLVTLAHPDVAGAVVPELCAEVMTERVAAAPGGGFAEAAAEAIEALAAARTVVALGPGLGQDPETVRCVKRLVTRVERPLVVDADGLNALQGELSLLRARRAPTVLTPHPGEAARLLASDAAVLNGDRVGAARRLAAQSGAVVVLKGAGSVVAAPEGRVLIVSTGGPVLATGGTGDVLTGIVAALLGAGLAPFEAAGLAAWWHGATADRAVQARAGFGLLASELADGLPACAEAIRGAAAAASEGAAAWQGEARDGGEHADALVHRFPGP